MQLAMPLEDSRAAVGLARRTGPSTSRAAAARVVAKSELMDAVAATLRLHPDGLTDGELFEVMGLPSHLRGSMIRRRKDAGAVDTGLRRPTPTGRASIVWTLR